MSNEFDLENRIKSKAEETAYSLKMQWDAPAFDGKWLLLVENRYDKKLYFRFFNSSVVEIRPTEGCNGMRRLFEALRQTTVPYFAIQDSDFARVCGKEPDEPNYFLTDCHDHEMMCLQFDGVMRAIFECEAITYDSSLVDEIFEDLDLLSKFKWYNYHHHSNLNFKNFNVCGHTMEELRTFKSISSCILPNSQNCTASITETDVLSFVNSQPHQDRFELTNGHDFLELLTKHIGEQCKNTNLRTDTLRQTMYASFTPDYFSKTRLYEKIRLWAGDRKILCLGS